MAARQGLMAGYGVATVLGCMSKVSGCCDTSKRHLEKHSVTEINRTAAALQLASARQGGSGASTGVN